MMGAYGCSIPTPPTHTPSHLHTRAVASRYGWLARIEVLEPSYRGCWRCSQLPWWAGTPSHYYHTLAGGVTIWNDTSAGTQLGMLFRRMAEPSHFPISAQEIFKYCARDKQKPATGGCTSG